MNERLLILFRSGVSITPKFGLHSVLIRNSVELAGRIGEFLPHLAGKLEYRDKIANTKPEAHCETRSLCYNQERYDDGTGNPFGWDSKSYCAALHFRANHGSAVEVTQNMAYLDYG